MKKVLIGYLIDGKTSGIDRYVLNLCHALQKQKVSMDILTYHATEELYKLAEKEQFRLVEVASLRHPLRQYRDMEGLFQRENYDVAYFNISEAFNSIGVLAAHRANVPRIVVHSHNSGSGSSKKIIGCFREKLNAWAKGAMIGNRATDYLACSKKAGQWLFSEKALKSNPLWVIYNTVDEKRYRFSHEIRRQKREELALDKKFVVGHVGNFIYQKNHPFLIDIMKELHKNKSDAVLLLIGDGPDVEKIKEKISREGLQDCVRYLGVRKDVPELMQAMDALVLPSHFEGLPFVAIESQMAGLFTLLSADISEETKISNRCKFVSLKESPETWAKKLLEAENVSRDKRDFTDNYELFCQTGQMEELLENLQLKEESGMDE